LQACAWKCVERSYGFQHQSNALTKLVTHVPGKLKTMQTKQIHAYTQLSTTIKVVSGYNHVM
jgi:hypothetical protein